MATNQPRPRGRPRRFDPEAAVAVAQALFHRHGYDGVGVADLTEALGINPPSFYAAFGSKAGLYVRVLEHWTRTAGLPLDALLRADRPVAECLAALLEAAARSYAADAATGGCLVLEGTRCRDADARAAACGYNLAAERVIRDYIAERHPAEAERLADFVATTMAGMSAKARGGHGLDQLLATARLAGAAVAQALPAEV